MHVQRPSARPALRSRGVLALSTALASLLAGPSCDNVACVFTEAGCVDSGSSGGIGSQPATRLATGDWVLPTAPTVARFLPNGTDAHPETPIVIEFSESMASESLEDAFEIMEVGGFAALPLNVTLTGDGRIGILSAVSGLDEGLSYQVLYREDAVAYDRTGQTLRAPEDRVLGEFTVTDMIPTQPRLLTSYPVDGATGASAITTLVAIFDRPIDETTLTPATFRVTVDGGAPPSNTGPVVLQATTGFGASAPDSRVVLWRAQDNLGDRLPLGDAALVELTLSNDGGGPVIEDDDGGVMAERAISFTTAGVAPPLDAQINSMPTDAIGVANLDGTTPLSVQVDFAVPALDGDVLEIYLVGRDLQDDADGFPRDSALLRTFPLSGGTVSTLLGEAELRLGAPTVPVTGVFRDGDVNIAFALVSGGVRTPVRVLDVDPLGPDVVDPVLDTTAPTLLSLGHFGEQVDEFRSNLVDLVVNGVTDEELRSVEVRTQIGLVQYTNGVLPQVASYDAQTGAFLAQAAPLGIVDLADLPTTLEVTLYDRALNASPTTMVPFWQLGASGPAPALPGPDVTVTVFDAGTLLPVAGALVLTHEDDGGVYSAVATATTNAQGRATLSSAIVGETIVTVDIAGYDLFSFHGVPTARLDVPLVPSGVTTGVVTAGLLANYEELSLLENTLFDARVPFPLDPRADASSCFFNPFTEQTGCLFDPYPVAVRRLGALTQFSLNTPATENLYSAESFLRGFGWYAPRAALEPGGAVFPELEAGPLLSSVGTPAEERAIDAPAKVLDLSGAIGLDLGNLAGDPVVQLEGFAPGLPANPVVGPGLAFDQGGNLWNARAAYPGVVDGILGGGGDLEGELVTSGALDGDHLYSAEITDDLGNRSGTRPRLTVAPGTLAFSPVSKVSAPVGNTGGASFDLDFDDVLPDALGQEGLYEVVVLDSVGRAWRLWRLDPADANGPTATVHLPDIALGGGTPLADGALAASVTAYSVPAVPGTLTYGGFDPTAFLWTDVARQRDRRTVGAPVLLTQP